MYYTFPMLTLIHIPLLLQENSVLHEKWVNEYGSTLTYKAFFGVRPFTEKHILAYSGLQMNRLYTTDMKAINHVLMNDYIYQKPEAARYSLSLILGSGVLIVEGDKHKQQVNLSNHLVFEMLKRLLASNHGTVDFFFSLQSYS